MDVLLRDFGARESNEDSASNRLLQDVPEYTGKPEKLEAAIKSASQEISSQLEYHARQLWQMRDGLRDTIREMCQKREGSSPEDADPRSRCPTSVMST